MAERIAMEAGLDELKALAHWADEQNHALTLQTTRKYRILGQPEEHIESTPGEAQCW